MVVEELDEESMKLQEERENRATQESITSNLEDWERRQTAKRAKERTVIARKTTKEESKKGKRRVYSIIEENWGEDSGLPNTTNINKRRRGNSCGE